ncbi:Wadjet anti-phage system protein JetD domain-containing protein [Bradyrhizobium sp.]|uniref:Wadjet anti-phage system protein JetD domain-containing protein n=1 Tax=Bradyrhizobium sp. TaxID=376 RepID=UPI0025BC41C2|nr:Wadjet anti-phage system protein JetD domain-containing protein [Bradyrhizobium sp.]
MDDLLDRHESGTASPFGYPDYSAFADVSEIDSFVKQLQEAEAAGAIGIVRGRGRNQDKIERVRLNDVLRLYDLLGRRPVGERAAQAHRCLLEGVDVPNEFEIPIAAIRAAWDRGGAWQGFAAQDADRLRTALLLAKAILEGKHRGVDYRTFSRRIAGESKALEKVEGAVVRILASALELPPAARPKDALRTLGLEKFAPPMLLAGRVDFDAAELSLARPTYFGIPPAEAHRVRLTERPRYLLTIENLASFNRHLTEADPEARGLTVYVGGYPSFATQDALRCFARAIPTEVPFYHWSDIDPDGTWIFRTIERIIERPLRPHLMASDLAEQFGRVPKEAVRPQRRAENSAISELIAYLERENAKWLEQEELDPVAPVEGESTFAR